MCRYKCDDEGGLSEGGRNEGEGNGKECLAASSLDSSLFCPPAPAHHCPTMLHMMHSPLIRSALPCSILYVLCCFPQYVLTIYSVVSPLLFWCSWYGAVLRPLAAPWQCQCFDGVVSWLPLCLVLYGAVWTPGTGRRCEWVVLVPVVGVGGTTAMVASCTVWSGPSKKPLDLYLKLQAWISGAKLCKVSIR